MTEMTTKEIKVLLFDLNKTLITAEDKDLPEFETELGVSQRDFFKVYSKNYCDDYNRGFLSDAEVFEGILKHLSAKKIDVGLCRELSKKRRTMIRGMKEVLESLAGRYRLILFTGEGKEFLKCKMEQFMLKKYFKEVFATCYVGLLKQEPEIYAKLIHDLDLIPSECVFIDDMSEFTTVAETFGINTILFKDAEQLKVELEGLGIKI